MKKDHHVNLKLCRKRERLTHTGHGKQTLTVRQCAGAASGSASIPFRVSLYSL